MTQSIEGLSTSSSWTVVIPLFSPLRDRFSFLLRGPVSLITSFSSNALLSESSLFEWVLVLEVVSWGGRSEAGMGLA